MSTSQRLSSLLRVGCLVSALALAACGGGSGTNDASSSNDAKDAKLDLATGDTAAQLETHADVAADLAPSTDVASSDVHAETSADVAPTEGGTNATPDAGVDAGSDGAKDTVVATDTAPKVDAGTDTVVPVAMCGKIKCDCTLNGIPLFGKYREVTFNEDFKIRETVFPDLKVQKTNFANSCGEWQEVTFGEDFTVRVVTFNEDFQIAYSNFPGVAKTPNQ